MDFVRIKSIRRRNYKTEQNVIRKTIPVPTFSTSNQWRPKTFQKPVQLYFRHPPHYQWCIFILLFFFFFIISSGVSRDPRPRQQFLYTIINHLITYNFGCTLGWSLVIGEKKKSLILSMPILFNTIRKQFG